MIRPGEKASSCSKQRLAVAHRAGRPPGEDLQRFRVGLDPFGRHDLPQPLGDRAGQNARKIEPLAPREDRDRDLRRLGGAEDELDVFRRLFQGLQQGVEGLAGEHVDFVDDVDFEPCPAGPHADVLPQLADFVDAAVAGPVDLQHVHVLAGADAAADVALVAGDRGGTLFAVQRLGQDSGGRGLAHPACAGEKIGMAHAMGRDGVRQGLGNVLLPDQLGKGLRPVAAGDDDVLARGAATGQGRFGVGGGGRHKGIRD